MLSIHQSAQFLLQTDYSWSGKEAFFNSMSVHAITSAVITLSLATIMMGCGESRPSAILKPRVLTSEETKAVAAAVVVILTKMGEMDGSDEHDSVPTIAISSDCISWNGETSLVEMIGGAENISSHPHLGKYSDVIGNESNTAVSLDCTAVIKYLQREATPANWECAGKSGAIKKEGVFSIRVIPPVFHRSENSALAVIMIGQGPLSGAVWSVELHLDSNGEWRADGRSPLVIGAM